MKKGGLLVMEKKQDFSGVKSVVTLISAYIGSIFEIISPAIVLLMFLMMVDYISGMLASKKEAIEHPNNKKYGWNSKKSIIGIYKKIGYVLTVLVAIITDYVIYELLRKIGIEYQVKTLFGFLVTIWFIINELLSILENAGRMGAMLPKRLKNILSELKKDIDEYDK